MSKRFMDGVIAERAVADELKIGRDAQRESDIERVRRSLERIAQAPSLTPEQRAASVEQTASENQRDIAKLQSQLDAQADTVAEQEQDILHLESEIAEQVASLQSEIAEQDAIITKQNERLDMLHDRIEQQQDGARHLAGRIDKLEWWRDRQHTVNQDIYRQMLSGYDKLVLACISGDDAMNQRIQARAIELEHRLDNYQTRLNRLEHQAKRVREQFPRVAESTIAEQCAASWPREEGDGE